MSLRCLFLCFGSIARVAWYLLWNHGARDRDGRIEFLGSQDTDGKFAVNPIPCHSRITVRPCRCKVLLL